MNLAEVEVQGQDHSLTDASSDDVAAWLDKFIAGDPEARATANTAADLRQRLAHLPLVALVGALDQSDPALSASVEVALYQAWIEGNTGISPLLFAAWFNLGTKFERAGDRDNAIAAYRNALALKPDFSTASINLSRILKNSAAPGTSPEEADEDAALERALVAGRAGYVTRIDSRAIFVDTEKYSAALVRGLATGGYEVPERVIVRATLRPEDRVLEAGTAVGVVAMQIAGIVSPANIMTFDASPAMVADARRNFAANRMGDIRSNVGVLRNRGRWSDSETEIDFFVSRDFVSSRLGAAPDSPDIVSVVRVPLVCLESKIAEHQANVLICDIEGGEADLLEGADLTPIRLIVVEIHYWSVGRQRIDDMIRSLVASGFNIDFNYSGGNIVVFDRPQ